MGRYANKTTVPVNRSKGKLEELVVKYGAAEFVIGWNNEGQNMIGFKMHDRSVRFVMPALIKDYDTQREREQRERTAWRALLLLVKAKLEAVESGFTVFEEEFLPHIITNTGATVYEELRPRLDKAAAGAPLMLPANFGAVS